MSAANDTVNAHRGLRGALAEVRQNTRLRVGLYLIVAVFWLYGLLVLRDHIAREKESWQGIESRIARVKSTAATADWTSRAQDVRAALSEYERLVWREGSIGISQATLQEWLQRSFTSAGVIVRAMQVSSQESASPSVASTNAANASASQAGNAGNPLSDLVVIRIRAQVEFRPQSLYAWLLSLNRDRLEKRPTVSIENLTIRSGQPAIADIEVLGYAQRNASATPAAGENPNRAPAAGAAR